MVINLFNRTFTTQQQTMKQSYLNLKIHSNVTLNVSGAYHCDKHAIHVDAGTEMIVTGFIPTGKRPKKGDSYQVRCIMQNGVSVTIPHAYLIKNKLGWKITDSDCNQWGRMVSPKRKRKAPQLFEFSELRWNGTENELYASTIDLKDYIKADMESDINSFGYTLFKAKEGLVNIHTEYGKDAHWIIAECIFELES